MSVLWNDLGYAPHKLPIPKPHWKGVNPALFTAQALLSFPSEPTPLAGSVRGARRAETLPEASPKAQKYLEKEETAPHCF